jgi:hypothetical protein
MVSKVIVTGYVPIQHHPRGPQEYGALGASLFGNIDCIAGDCVIMPLYETLQETWLWKLVQASHRTVSHSTGDNRDKNSLAYHCVNHQKMGWLLKAALKMPRVDTFVWLDYGAGHLPGVTPAVVNDFIASIRPDDFAIPGCWEEKTFLISDFFPCWRFCGTLIVVPRHKVHALYKATKTTIHKHIAQQNNIPWEVNTLAEAEDAGLIKPRWYKADHDASMFNNYAKPPQLENPHAVGNAADRVGETVSEPQP